MGNGLFGLVAVEKEIDGAHRQRFVALVFGEELPESVDFGKQFLRPVQLLQADDFAEACRLNVLAFGILLNVFVEVEEGHVRVVAALYGLCQFKELFRGGDKVVRRNLTEEGN